MKPEKDLMSLQNMWDKILKDSGFNDIEDKHVNLKRHDTRTQSFQNQAEIRELFLILDNLLAVADGLPKFERKVLELYSQGTRINVIVSKTRASDRHVRNVIKRYQVICKAFMLMR